MTANIIGWILVVLISVIGWVLSSKQSAAAIKSAASQNEKSVKKAAEDAAIAATKEFTRVTDTVENMKKGMDSLPCVKDANYMLQSGKLMQQVTTLQSGQDKLEKKIDDFMQTILRANLVKSNDCKDK
jgi:uncharacterized Zn ribbon protein